MSREIVTQLPFSASGATLYAVIDRAGQRWNGTAFEAVLAAHWTSYAVALAEDAGTAHFAGTMPAAIVAGPVDVVLYLRAGGSAAPSDAIAAAGSGYWDGTALTAAAVLAPAGLDAVTVEAGVNARQALSPILSAACAPASGLESTEVLIKAAGAGNSGTTRIAATVDADGNRTSVTLNLPA